MASFLEILDGINKTTTTIGNTADSISKAGTIFQSKTGTAPVAVNSTSSGGNSTLLLVGLGALLLFGKKLF